MGDFSIRGTASISFSVRLSELHWRSTQTVWDFLLPDGLTIHYRLPISLCSSTTVLKKSKPK
jgi:hypothetical protein